MQFVNDTTANAAPESGAEAPPFLVFAAPGEIRKARQPSYSPESAAGAVLAAALSEGAAMIAANARAMATSPDAAPLHQLRVGLRRARTTLWAGRRLCEEAALRALGDRARTLGQSVAQARALDVLRHETLPKLEPEASAALGDPGPARRLAARLDRAAPKFARAARTPENLLEATLLALDLAAASRRLEGRDQDAAVAAHAPKATRRSAKRWAVKALRRAARRVLTHAEDFEEMSIEARHELRKDVKKLRYALDAFRPLFAELEIEPLRRATRRLGNALGSLNDAADAALITVFAPEAHHAKAAAAMLSVADARAEADAAKAAERWRALRATPRFWEG